MTMLLLAVSLQTMKEYAWHSDRLIVLLPDCVMLLLAEVLVDWVRIAIKVIITYRNVLYILLLLYS